MPDPQIWAYADDLKRYAAYLCHHVQDAEDVAQNALLKAAQSHGGTYRAEASVRTWLHTIATNECRMLRRRLNDGSLDTLLEGSPDLPGSDGGFRRPEDAAILAEIQSTVLRSMKTLPRPYQQVLALRDGCGMSTSEVAGILNITEGAVKSRLYRARRALRLELDAAVR